MKQYIIGIDMGGTTIKMGLFSSKTAELIKKWHIPTRKEKHGVHLLPDIAASIQDILSEFDLGLNDIKTAGMCVPGAVLDDGYVAPCANLNHWGDFYPAMTLGSALHVPVRVTNDANAAAIGEFTFGGGKDCNSQFFITLGTGIGGTTIINGHVITGSHGAAGEIGHMKVRNDETRVCGCGKTGCLEQYASAPGIVTCTKIRLSKKQDASLLRDIAYDKMTCKDIFDVAKKGDTIACECVEEMACVLGSALACVSCVVDPEIIVIGGGVSAAGPILIDSVKKYFIDAAFPVCRATDVVLSELGNDAGIYGAMELARSTVTL